MSSYININLISLNTEVLGLLKRQENKRKMPVMWENEYDRKTHILETTGFQKV